MHSSGDENRLRSLGHGDRPHAAVLIREGRDACDGCHGGLWHPRVPPCGAGAVGQPPACARVIAGTCTGRRAFTGLYLLALGRGRKADGKTDPSFAAVISSGEAAFSEKPRLLLQIDAIDKFAISLVPNSRPTVALLFTSQHFLIF